MFVLTDKTCVSIDTNVGNLNESVLARDEKKVEEGGSSAARPQKLKEVEM